MGISGLLPALKSIQVTKHLSEFAGQTLAVDAYVWLHRGIHSCATELATGKDTHKYVDYAMYRVRLLRHHKIEPYIVFDGGPLPAKRGTEDDRQKRREESLARGNALAAQGKHAQAREYYVKCVDVTPQMAFQFIKALRAESVSYVVAPYEADAQLAYLERIGIVDAIITEDSDLLVFGCQNVLFKLDVVANTVVSIARKDFGSVSGSNSDISLVGWSDVQFRSMAILSGCDYLPSIPGVGLKTACALLRKWKTAEQVVRVILLEGKKAVPRKYLQQFLLAEKCFQHQRVYCPLKERLVYLNDVDSDWTDEAEGYVGGDLEPGLAKSLALGDVDPVTHSPMKDICPSYVPHERPAPLAFKELNRRDKGKSKGPPKEGILSFFGANPKIPSRQGRGHPSPISVKKTVTGISSGKASGKRTLAEVMDHDIAIKKRKQKSKFFESVPATWHAPDTVAGPSRSRENKENVFIVLDDDEVEPDSTLSIQAQGNLEMDLADPSTFDAVQQEDGYISPSPSDSGDAQDLSSPLRPDGTPIRKISPRPRDREFVEAVSSPPSQVKQHVAAPRSLLRTRSLDLPHLQPSPFPTPGPISSLPDDPSSASFPGLDLRHSFDDGHLSDIDCSEEDVKVSPTTPTPSPPTPTEDQCTDADEPPTAHEKRTQAVVMGWRQRWAHGGRAKAQRASLPNLMRRETNVTPRGRHTLPHPESRLRSMPYLRTAPNSASKVTVSVDSKPRRAETRRSLSFFNTAKGISDSVDEDEIKLPSQKTLEHLRCAS
ncbi:hypothetical protein H0H81_002627 [Sphagnurus paluster]|uniref:Exonuclease 1 n=1 Tax=Sphagnurus paluster TaxID=117069 RepID=A0A9P7GTY6_9AGAR|nr:hypothetical protein H0H81_002627 [Sphagnurus paluster]